MTDADSHHQHHVDRHHEEEYSDALVDFLEVLWGEGYLSPGGAEEVARVLDGIDLTGRRVLDVGCGSGGIALSLAADYGAAHVTGIDVEDTVLGKAQDRAASNSAATSSSVASRSSVFLGKWKTMVPGEIFASSATRSTVVADSPWRAMATMAASRISRRRRRATADGGPSTAFCVDALVSSSVPSAIGARALFD